MFLSCSFHQDTKFELSKYVHNSFQSIAWQAPIGAVWSKPPTGLEPVTNGSTQPARTPGTLPRRGIPSSRPVSAPQPLWITCPARRKPSVDPETHRRFDCATNASKCSGFAPLPRDAAEILRRRADVPHRRLRIAVP